MLMKWKRRRRRRRRTLRSLLLLVEHCCGDHVKGRPSVLAWTFLIQQMMIEGGVDEPTPAVEK